MPSTLANFQLSAVAAPDDFIVGYDEAVLNGERRWTVSTIANAVSGVASLGTVKSVTGTAPISVANGTTTPAISIADATTTSVGVAELATLSEVQGGIGTNTIVTPANLNTLLNTLSTNIMQTIGNYPYLEYAWVTEPNTAGQTITADTITTLTLNTEVADTGNFGSVNGSNQITLAAGTYQFEANTHGSALGITGGAGTLALYNISDSLYVSRGSSQSGASDNCDNPILKGQFTIAAQKTFDLRYYNANLTTYIKNTTNNSTSTISTANAEQRTTIKLWKVG